MSSMQAAAVLLGRLQEWVETCVEMALDQSTESRAKVVSSL
jgi:hypothetical protein